MASELDNHDDDSFIILGTSPGTSLDMKVNGITNGDTLEESQIEDVMKDLSIAANMAFKAHFKLGDCPSPASMMVASNIVSEDKSTEELQTRFGELLDENILLKETLKQNNDSMKEQFLLIASCQEDMMKTHMMHKEKFDETRDLVERLRQENKKLKQDILRLTEVIDPQVNSETGEQSKKDSSKAGDSVNAGDSGKAGGSGKSGPSSAVEFVSSPDDDTINKLTAQLELVEKQRRQVIVENEKLTWQKESLEHMIDATSKERDELKEKLKNLEINMSREETRRRDTIVQQLEAKITTLQGDFKNSQLKILDLENVKMEFTRHKSGTVETIKLYKDQIQDLNNRLKEAQTTVFQPVRFSVSSEHESTSLDYPCYLSNVKLYDRALKHLSEYLNSLTHGTSDSLMQTLGLATSLLDFKLDKTTVEQFKAGLNEMKQQLEKQHNAVLANIGQVRATMTIFEGIFKDYNEVLKKNVTKEKNEKRDNAESHSVEALTQALVARGQEIQTLEAELKAVKAQNETCDVLKAQLELYKSDFEAEREARQKMASEKETILTDLRKAQRRTQELTQQLEESHQQHSSAASNQRPASVTNRTTTGTPKNSTTSASGTVRKKKKVSSKEEEVTARETTPPPLRFDCPVCDKPFKSLLLLQQHVDTCLM